MDKNGKQNLPPVKVAVLIDGGFFIKRFNAQYNKDRSMTPDEVADHLYTMAHCHVATITFYTESSIMIAFH